MKFFCILFLLSPAASLLAQNPPPKPAQVPQPNVTMTVENPGTPAPAVPPDRVVITVGEHRLTAAQFDQIVDSLPEQYRTAARTTGRKQLADQVARILALADEGKVRKLDQTPAYATQSAFADANVLASAVYTDVSRSIKPSEADERAYYEAHRNEFDQVHARHILIRAEGSPVPVRPGQKALTDAEALAKIQELRSKIVGGADFAAIAQAESDDTGSAPKGGDLGSFKHGQMVPTFEEAAFKLKPGEISEPVKSQFGYHLIKVESVQGFAETRPEIERRVTAEQAQKQIEELQKKTPAVLDPEFFGLQQK